jgi:hypothetical protein
MAIPLPRLNNTTSHWCEKGLSALERIGPQPQPTPGRDPDPVLAHQRYQFRSTESHPRRWHERCESSDERQIVQAHEKASQGRTSAELANWNPSSSKHMAEVQVQLLMTALRAVRVGGRVVYSTRSISREENDGVVEKAITLLGKEAKKGSLLWTAEVEQLDGEVERRLEADWAEKTAKGWAVLPDNASGGKWGPLYFSVLTKKST